MAGLAACGPSDEVQTGPAVTGEADMNGLSCEGLYDGGDAQIVAPDRVYPACDTPSEVFYEEVSASWGFVPVPGPVVEHNLGGVLAVADMDGDGHQDILFGYARSEVVLFRNHGSGFSPRTLPGSDGSGPLSLVDIDGDGDLDVVSAGPPFSIFRNDDGVLVVEPMAVQVRSAAVSVSPGDLNGDGMVDLFVPASGLWEEESEERADYVLMGDGSGGFEEIVLPSPDAGGIAFDSVALDMDLDGDIDFYTVNDFGPQHGGNVLWENVDGVLESRKDDCACDLEIAGMGADAGDLDGDGLPELLVASTGSNHLLQQTGDGVFADIAEAVGADPLMGVPTMSWGQIFFDHDDDGLLDLVVTEGDLWLSSTDPELRGSYDAPLHLLANTGSLTEPRFEARGDAVGLTGLGSWRAVVPADINGDGRLDLVITDVVGPPKLFLARGCSGNGAIEVDVPLHARVEACIAGERHVRWATTESGWGGAKAPTVRFGTGRAPAPDQVVVVAPAP